MSRSKVALAVLAVFVSGTAAAQSLSTGVAPWLVNGNPVVVENPLATPFWIGNFADALWVGTTSQDGNLAGGAAPGTYTFTLNLGAYVGTAGAFAINYAADNSVTWSITNGSLSGTTACTNDCFSSGNGAPRAMAGSFAATSILTATVVNLGITPTPMGLMVQGVAAPIPEPATWALWGVGALGLLAWRRKAAA